MSLPLLAVAVMTLQMSAAPVARSVASHDPSYRTAQGKTAAQDTPHPASTSMSPREVAEMRADILMARKEFEDAVRAYEALLATYPKDSELLNKTGIAFQQQGFSTSAEHYYKLAVKYDKDYVSAINNVGTVEYERKKYARAVKWYERAINVHPDMATLYSNLGYAYFADKKYPEAMGAFVKAIQLDPEIFQRRGGSGALVQQRSVPDPGMFYFYMARSYGQMGNAERCAHYLKMSRDDGYQQYTAATSDPAFSKVIQDPQVKEILNPVSDTTAAQ
jgi:tetratricopeptide (TPR) repeat protein